MTADDESVTTQLAEIATAVDGLHDLFRRRLLDDRDKRAVIQTLTDRAEALERRREPALLRPLVAQLAPVVDRMDVLAREDATVASIREELLEVLGYHGVVQVPDRGPVISTAHEVVSVVPGQAEASTGAELVVEAVVRRGYAIDDVVVRPAQVVARFNEP